MTTKEIQAIKKVELIMNPGPALIDAVCQVIHAEGFHAMAVEYKTHPEYREEIKSTVYRSLLNGQNSHLAEKFRKLEMKARTMAEKSGK